MFDPDRSATTIITGDTVIAMNSEDVLPLLDEIDRFARERIFSSTERPEHPLSPRCLEALTQEAVALGIISPSISEDGFGIWDHTDSAEAMLFNIGALRHLGHANPGVAFSWHRGSLAHGLAKQLGFTLNQERFLATTLSITGHYGLGRYSLARWLKGVAMPEEDQLILGDWLNRQQHASPILATEDWQCLLWPQWIDGQIVWRLSARADENVCRCAAQHGFDELSSYLVLAHEQGDTRSLDTAEARNIYQRMLKADCIGLMAIAVGALQRGQNLAAEYAAIRKQGSKRIDHHPAVQFMLGEVEMTLQHAEAVLGMLTRPLDELDLGVLLSMRARLHESLCQAANHVVQVHVGIGYMRDCGAEKIVRDLNMLKLQSGGTREIPLFLAAWMEK